MELKELSKQINRMLVTAVLALVLIIIMGIAPISCNQPGQPETPLALSQEELTKRGAYLVNIYDFIRIRTNFS